MPGAPLVPVSIVRWAQRQRWSSAIGGSPLVAVAAQWEIVDDPWPRRRRIAGRIWLPAHLAAPGQAQGAPQWEIVEDDQPRRRRIAGRVWLPAQHAETAVVHPWSTLRVVGKRSPQRGRLRVGGLLAQPPFTVAAPRRGPFVRRDERIARWRPGWVLCLRLPNVGAAQSVWYHVYGNTGAGDAINYLTPVATVNGLSWTSPPLSYPGDWKFGARAFYYPNGLEEQNLDCAIEIILDSHGNDITNRPAPPTGLRALAVKGGNIKVEWSYPTPVTAAKTPTGFHVYIGIGAPTYATPAATVSYASAILATFTTTLTGLANSTTYTIGVRAFNGTAEEPNTTTVSCTSDATGPSAVQALTGMAV